jgi:hypothetical protein
MPPTKEALMTTLRIDNTVRDFDSWKTVFDKFERFRRDHGVRRYRLSRDVAEPNRVTIDLDFDTLPEAETFLDSLWKIWETPQSKAQVIDSRSPRVLDVVVHRAL